MPCASFVRRFRVSAVAMGRSNGLAHTARSISCVEALKSVRLVLMRSTFALPVLVLCVARVAWADGSPSLGGRWSAGVMHSAWSLANWADECGPSPVSSNEAGGIVSITQNAGEFTISGLGRAFTSNACWDQQPGMAAVAHTAGPRQWQTTCRSAANDPRRATVTTTLLFGGTTLDLEETGRYEVAIAGRQCLATVHRTRHYALVQGDSVPNTPPAEGMVEKPAANCGKPGPASRIEVSPTYKLAKPGEQFVFRARLYDENGCPVSPQKVTWRLIKGPPGVHVDATGKLTVAADASESEAQVSAAIGDQSVVVTTYIVSAQRYAELLNSPSFNNAGESDAKSVKSFAPSVVGTGAPQIDTTARSRRTVFVWSVALLAAIMGVAAVVVAKRRRNWVTNQEVAVHKARTPAYSEGESPETTPTQRICPICGEQYDSTSQFCGKDGANLVPLN